MNKTISIRLVLMTLIALAGWLGISYLNYNSYSRSIQISPSSNLTKLSKYNLLSNSTEQLSREMELQAQELDNVLEFMVWPDERLKLLKQSTQLTQQQINHQPSQLKYWQRLLKLQYELSPAPEQLSWILDKVYKLGGWNESSIINLSRYCVPFAFKEGNAVPESCYEIVNRLPQQDQKSSLARRIGVSAEDLDVVLSRYQTKE